MKIEEQICNLELSQKLRDLGVPQESRFWWVDVLEGWNIAFIGEIRQDGYDGGNPIYRWYRPHTDSLISEIISAYSVAELGNLISEYRIEDWKMASTGEWVVCTHIGKKDIRFTGKTEADARAKMLIHLTKNNLISWEEQ